MNLGKIYLERLYLSEVTILVHTLEYPKQKQP